MTECEFYKMLMPANVGMLFFALACGAVIGICVSAIVFWSLPERRWLKFFQKVWRR